MWRLTPYQLIRLWSELEQAYYGDNKYGSDTAEIYAYTLMEYYPTISDKPNHEAYDNAREALIEVLDMFMQQRECNILIDGANWQLWMSRKIPFDHRVHIQVLH